MIALFFVSDSRTHVLGKSRARERSTDEKLLVRGAHVPSRAVSGALIGNFPVDRAGVFSALRGEISFQHARHVRSPSDPKHLPDRTEDALPDSCDGMALPTRDLLLDHLAMALDNLDARSRRIVEERWLKVNDDGSGGMTLHELAAVYGVSAERIRQIEVAAMKKMKASLAEFA